MKVRDILTPHEKAQIQKLKVKMSNALTIHEVDGYKEQIDEIILQAKERYYLQKEQQREDSATIEPLVVAPTVKQNTSRVQVRYHIGGKDVTAEFQGNTKKFKHRELVK